MKFLEPQNYEHKIAGSCEATWAARAQHCGPPGTPQMAGSALMPSLFTSLSPEWKEQLGAHCP